MKIGVLASGFVVPQTELAWGVQSLEKRGWKVRVHPQVKKKHLFFAGDDEARLQAWIDYAWSKDLQVVWCARGGHGALRLLELLAAETKKRGIPPKKLLVGYSDATLLMEFARQVWGWATLHAPMPGGRELLQMSDAVWNRLEHWVQAEPSASKIHTRPLKLSPLNGIAKKSGPVQGELIGGNLTVLTCLIGTPWQPQVKRKILFLEDVGEMWFRVDRMMAHLHLAADMSRLGGIVLGTFSGCRDATVGVLKPSAKLPRLELLRQPREKDLEPLRAVIPNPKAFKEIFRHWGDRWGVPVWNGLNSGHGGGHEPLPLGSQVSLAPQGSKTSLEFVSWDWKVSKP